MLIEEKKQKVMEILNRQGFVAVSELSKELKSSEVTIRKILNDLDRKGHLKRARGGAVLLSSALHELAQKEKEQKNQAEKEAIARQAYELIEDDDSVFLDAGSTTLKLVQLIKNGTKRKIVVATNALNIAAELVDVDDLELILVGGGFRHKILSCVGPIAEKVLEGLHFDKVFLGTNAISAEQGLTTPNVYEAQIKKVMLKSAKKVYVLTDYSKFNKVSLVSICDIKDIDFVVTDWNVAVETIHELQDRGTTVIQVAAQHSP